MQCDAFSLVEIVIRFALPVFSAWLGYKFALRSRNDERRRKSIHDTADVFAAEAAKWCDFSFRIDSRFIESHQTSIYRLRGHIEYIQDNHKLQWSNVRDLWNFYSGEEKPLTEGYYLGKKRENFISTLYKIADTLRRG
jgi:hypothetical protein